MEVGTFADRTGRQEIGKRAKQCDGVLIGRPEGGREGGSVCKVRAVEEGNSSLHVGARLRVRVSLSLGPARRPS